MTRSLPRWLQSGFDFDVLQISSNGNFNCSVLTSRSTLANYILKTVNLGRNDIATSEKILKIFGKFKHPNIVQLIRVKVEDFRIIYILSEYMGGCNYADMMSKSGPLSLPKIKHIMYQVASALQYIHENNMVHGNLVPENILTLNQKEYPLVKVSDCGMFTLRLKEPWTNYFHQLYHAPEVLRGDDFSLKSDIWSFGIILAESILGISATETSFSEYLSVLVEEEGNLFQNILHCNPTLRYNSTTIKNHEFFKGTVQKSEEVIQAAFQRKNYKKVSDSTLEKSSFLNTDGKFIRKTDLSKNCCKDRNKLDYKFVTNDCRPPLTFIKDPNNIEKEDIYISHIRKIMSLPDVDSSEGLNSDRVTKNFCFGNDSGIYSSRKEEHRLDFPKCDNSLEHYFEGSLNTEDKNSDSEISGEYYSCEEELNDP